MLKYVLYTIDWNRLFHFVRKYGIWISFYLLLVADCDKFKWKKDGVDGEAFNFKLCEMLVLASGVNWKTMQSCWIIVKAVLF